MPTDSSAVAPKTTFDYLLRANPPRNWSPEIRGERYSFPAAVGRVAPSKDASWFRRGFRFGLRLISGLRPLIVPVAWRVRTFLSKPIHDVENRLTARMEGSEARLLSLLDGVTESLRAADRASIANASQQRKLYVSLRDLIEEQSREIARLESELGQREILSQQTGAR